MGRDAGERERKGGLADYLVNQTADGEWKAFCNFDNYDAWSRKELMLEPTVCLQALNDQIIYPDEAKLKRPQVENRNLYDLCLCAPSMLCIQLDSSWRRLIVMYDYYQWSWPLSWSLGGGSCIKILSKTASENWTEICDGGRGGWKDGQLDVLMLDGWVDGSFDGWKAGKMDRWTFGCWMVGGWWVGHSMDGWWKDG